MNGAIRIKKSMVKATEEDVDRLVNNFLYNGGRLSVSPPVQSNDIVRGTSIEVIR